MVATEAFRAGARVRHAIFGSGEVVCSDGERQCTVRFDDGREVSIWRPERHLEPTAPNGQQPAAATGTRALHDAPATCAQARASAYPGLSFEPRWVPIAAIGVDRHYQRPTSQARVASMARTWSQARCGAIDVSLRPDGTYWCFDGGHRLAAAARAGETMIYCHVHRYDPAQEAAEFVALQRDRASVGTVHQFKARVAAGEPVATAIESIVHEMGYSVDYGNTRALGAIGCVAALETLYRSYKVSRRSAPPEPTPERLRAVLSLVERTWGRHHEGCTDFSLRAVDYLLRRYGSELDQARFVKRLGCVDLAILRKRADQQRKLVGLSGWLCLAAEMLKSYNHGLRENRLPGFGPEAATEE